MADSLILGLQRDLDSQLQVPVDALKQKIEELRRMINRDDLPEPRFQKWFEENPEFLMMGGTYCQIKAHPRLEQEGERTHIPDFILTRTNDLLCDILDIKLPKQNVVVSTDYGPILSQPANRAIRQVDKYVLYFRESSNRKRIKERYELDVLEPKILILIGEDISSEDRALVQRTCHNLDVLTYGDIIRHMENMLRSKEQDTAKVRQALEPVLAHMQRQATAEPTAEEVNPATGRRGSEITQLKTFLREMNMQTEKGFLVVKKRLAPNSGDIGIAYSDYTDSRLMCVLYGVPEELNDLLIKEITEQLVKELRNQGRRWVYYPHSNPMKDDPKGLAVWHIFEIVQGLVQEKGLIHSPSQFMAKEIIYSWLETIGGTSYQAQLGWSDLEQLQKDVLKTYPVRYPPSPPPPDELRAIAKRTKHSQISIQDRTRMPTSSFRIFFEALDFLKAEGVAGVENPYKLPRCKGLPMLDYDWTKCSLEDVEHDVRVFLNHAPEVFEHLMERNFPGLPEKYRRYKGASILAFYDIRLNEDNPSEAPVVWLAFFKSEASDETGVTVVSVKDHPDLTKALSDWSIRQVSFGGRNYSLVNRQGSVADMFIVETPVLQYAYQMIADVLRAYFHKDLELPRNVADRIKAR